jgi:hypothetical protein
MKNNRQIILAYPCATSGNFFASLIQLIISDFDPDKITETGSLHAYTKPRPYKSIVLNSQDSNDDIEHEWPQLHDQLELDQSSMMIGHFRALNAVHQYNPDIKIFYITVDNNQLAVQESNFIRKIMLPNWSERWYNIYRSDHWPTFDQLPPVLNNINQLPVQVQNGILGINRNYILNWRYDVPSAACELPLSLLATPDILYNTIINALNVRSDVWLKKHSIEFINSYVRANYEN